jgi:hypothetical protein
LGLDQKIEYFRKAYTDAPTRDLALVAFGIYAGLVMAKNLEEDKK